MENSRFLSPIESLIESIARVHKKFWLPLSYFNQYHSSKTPIDKLIKLSIVWESTILNGIQSELSYRFALRGTHLLKETLNFILKTAYDVRSCIVHTGDIDSSAAKKMRNLFNEDDSDSLVFFKFIKDYLEPVTRNILNEFLQKCL